MTTTTLSDADRILREIPALFRGPGGALAIIRNGRLLSQYTYGFADMDRRIPMSSTTVFPICSLTKQMVALILSSLHRNPTRLMLDRQVPIKEQFTIELHNLLPEDIRLHPDGPPTISNLHSMQSGLRDVYAQTALWGARPDDPFSLESDAPRALDRCRALHFTPGTDFSYCNLNFYLLARVIEGVSGVPLARLLAERVFEPAGMATANLTPNTAGHPLSCVGYEGSGSLGYFAAKNRLEWSGDAGVTASLEDMVAYEIFLQREWQDENSVYRNNAQSSTYKDGSPAFYNFGLWHRDAVGCHTIGHPGALRGYRIYRAHLPQRELSVVVLFNHEREAFRAVQHIVRRLLDVAIEPIPALVEPSELWAGQYLSEDSLTLISVKTGGPGTIVLDDGEEQILQLSSTTQAERNSFSAAITRENLTLLTHRSFKKGATTARRIQCSPPCADISNLISQCAGTYREPMIDSTFKCVAAGSVMYVHFEGFLGKGPVRIMHHVGEDVWSLADPRGLDAPAPGYWTVVFHRDRHDRVEGVTIGNPLAMRLEYARFRGI